MWAFCFNSLFREYGLRFFTRVALPHPIRTAAAVADSGSIDFSDDVIAVARQAAGVRLLGPRPIVGLGFCLKPIEPPCPSGRPNHRCVYLENLPQSEPRDIPAACGVCVIREFGLMTLKTGAAFYIMTSARDILMDVFVPALEQERFSSGLFTLCRYSLRPFAVGLLASGMQGLLVPFESGDCRDYAAWLRADRGIKEERTEIASRNGAKIEEVLADAAKDAAPFTRFEIRGNVFFSRPAAETVRANKQTTGPAAHAGEKTG